MPVSYEVRSLYRFGVFELDAHTGELRRNGIKLKLQDQPCRFCSNCLNMLARLSLENNYGQPCGQLTHLWTSRPA